MSENEIDIIKANTCPTALCMMYVALYISNLLIVFDFDFDNVIKRINSGLNLRGLQTLRCMEETFLGTLN